MADLTPEEKQKIYAEEKVRMEAQDQLKRESQKKAAQKKSNETLIGLIVIVVLAVILWKSNIFDSFLGSSSTSNTANAAPEATLQASELFRAYENNEVSADALYKGKIILVSGLVNDIGKDIIGDPYVTLSTGNSIWTVQCMFSSKQEGELAALRKGQSVSIKGECNGKLINVLLRKCTLQ
jgi:hypothetical protein